MSDGAPEVLTTSKPMTPRRLRKVRAFRSMNFAENSAFDVLGSHRAIGAKSADDDVDRLSVGTQWNLGLMSSRITQ